MTELAEDKTSRDYRLSSSRVSILALRPVSESAQTSGGQPLSTAVLAARGEFVPSKMVGTPSPECAALRTAEDQSDKARSVVFLRLCAFEFLDTGDLTWNTSISCSARKT